MNKLKSWLKKASCKHYYAELARWHWCHENGMEPARVEAEYKCSSCGKTVYLHLNGRESHEWAKVMGKHKQDGYLKESEGGT